MKMKKFRRPPEPPMAFTVYVVYNRVNVIYDIVSGGGIAVGQYY